MAASCPNDEIVLEERFAAEVKPVQRSELNPAVIKRELRGERGITHAAKCFPGFSISN